MKTEVGMPQFLTYRAPILEIPIYGDSGRW